MQALNLGRYHHFLIDMDDTLYEERDFVFSGFRAVAKDLRQRGIDPEWAWQYLRARFINHGRERIFDHLLADCLGTEMTDADITHCVGVYRQHQPCIALYPGVKETLTALREHGRLVVVTDGAPEVQQRKFAALELDSLVDDLICCWEHAPKPDPQAVASVVTANQSDALLIGDNPAHDLALADTLGIDCIRVRTGRFAECTSSPWQPITEIYRFSDLSV